MDTFEEREGAGDAPDKRREPLQPRRMDTEEDRVLVEDEEVTR
jgi:hypothetical protein